MQLGSLQDVLEAQLGDLYDAEKQLLVALPKMTGAAYTDELREAFRTHLEETRGHVERLERVFSDLGMPMPIEQCKAMRGLVAEGDEIVLATGDPVAKDAALIAVAQRVEHYEIAGYGTVRPPGVKRRRPEGWARPSLRPMNSLIASRCGAVAFRRR